jgi:glycerophosphoryl diester phosphodiesterase
MRLLLIFLSIFTTSYQSVNPMEHSYDSINMQTTFDKQGHRGCRGLMPENTIPAMLYALDLGVTTLEMDVVITKDKQVLLSHEPFFNHTISTNSTPDEITSENEKEWNIFRLSYEEVKRVDVGQKPHPRFPRQQKMAVVKPLLRDLFDSVTVYLQTHNRPHPYFNIETKSVPATDGIYHPGPAEFVELLMKVVQEKKMERFVIIQSFDFRTLHYLHQHYPQIQTAMLVEDRDPRSLDDQIKALGFVPTIFSPPYGMVTEKLVKQCKERKMKLIPWTVNTQEEIEQLKRMGVDGIISDYPDLF